MPEEGDRGLRVGLHVLQLLRRVTGGIGRYTDLLARSLHEAGVTVVPFAGGPAPEALPEDLQAAHVEITRPSGRWLVEAWQWARRPRLTLDGVDLVHATSLSVPPVPDVPLVVTVHDVAFLRHPQYFPVHGLRFHERGLHLARKEAAAVVVPSRFVAAELLEEGFDLDRVHVACHGIHQPPPRDDADLDATLARLGVEGPYVLFVGTLEPRKGVDVLVPAFAALRREHPDVSLVMVGHRGWGKLPDLDLPGIRHLGGTPDDDLDALYRRALVLAHPSYYEGFGLPVLEAMARGCPVVATATSSIPEVAGTAARLVEPGDAAAFAEGLDEVVTGEAVRARLSQAGRERASEFSWEASVAAHRTAYRSAFMAVP